MFIRAVDSSYDPLTEQEARCLRENGWPLFIQCLLALPRTGPEQPVNRILSLRNAVANNLQVAGYIVMGNVRSGAEYIDMGRLGVPDGIWDALKFVAVDVEVPGIQVDEIIGAVRRVQELGKRPLIYTNANTWLNYITPANDTRLARMGISLWNAFWDGNPDIDFISVPFGGWNANQVALEQWSGGTFVCQQFVDRNTVEHPELINLEGGGDHMPTPEYNELKERVNQVDSLVEAILKGDAHAPIWPVGIVPLKDIYHRAYYSKNRLDTLTQAVQAARQTLEEHLVQHNTSGGPLDRYSGQYLTTMANLLDQMESEVRALAVAAAAAEGETN